MRELTKRELATILAALRFHQDENLQGGGDIPDRHIREIATDCGRLKPLSLQEVNKLCEKLNVGNTHRPGHKRNRLGLHVIVTVSGGVADVLLKPRGVALAIYDYDVEGADDNGQGVSNDPDGQRCCISEWALSEEIVGCEHWPVVRKAREGRYSRTWRCPGCGRSTECSYEDIPNAALPVEGQSPGTYRARPPLCQARTSIAPGLADPPSPRTRRAAQQAAPSPPPARVNLCSHEWVAASAAVEA